MRILLLAMLLLAACAPVAQKAATAPQDTSSTVNGCANHCDNPALALQAIRDDYGVIAAEYTIDCLECDMDRGGYIKAQLSQNGHTIQYFNHWGWCSSGGTDCGKIECVTSSDANTRSDYAAAKQAICARLTLDPEMVTPPEDPDRYSRACNKGDYETDNGEVRTLSVMNYGRTVREDNPFGDPTFRYEHDIRRALIPCFTNPTDTSVPSQLDNPNFNIG